MLSFVLAALTTAATDAPAGFFAGDVFRLIRRGYDILINPYGGTQHVLISAGMTMTDFAIPGQPTR